MITTTNGPLIVVGGAINNGPLPQHYAVCLYSCLLSIPWMSLTQQRKAEIITQTQILSVAACLRKTRNLAIANRLHSASYKRRECNCTGRLEWSRTNYTYCHVEFDSNKKLSGCREATWSCVSLKTLLNYKDRLKLHRWLWRVEIVFHVNYVSVLYCFQRYSTLNNGFSLEILG